MKTIIPIIHKPVIVPDASRHMELIVKPTEKCNFKCTFCSSTNITDDKDARLDLQHIFTFLQKYPNTGTIIVNGGDPLMVPVSYYWSILDYIEQHGLPTTLSLTTNLWAFYKNPDKWSPLFNHPKVGVATSFNFGDTRKIDENTVFTKEHFLAVVALFYERVGYKPDFISVISEENASTAIDNVRLAKELDVECKLNYAMSSGAQQAPFQLSKMYDIYTKIHELDLWPWEHNTKVMMRRLTAGTSTCPQNRSCDEGIRCLQPSGDYYSCGSFGDDRLFPIDFTAEMQANIIATPLQDDFETMALKSDCFTCPMFNICNGCRKTVYDMKRANMVESHCSLMKTISSKIIQINETSKSTIIDLLPKKEDDRKHGSNSTAITR